MNNSAENARKLLKIQAVRLLSCDVKKKTFLTNLNASDIDGTTYTFNSVNGLDFMEGKSPDGVEIFNYIFYFGAGVKIDSDNPDDKATPSVVEIKAVFEAEYTSNKRLNESDLMEFSKKDVGYHAWPYWREFVSNSLGRMSLPNDLIPVSFEYTSTKGVDTNDQ